MLLRTKQPPTRTELAGCPSNGREVPVGTEDSPLPRALDLCSEIVTRYEISDLSGLLTTVSAAAAQDEISVAVLGRFKAGKSSFLNNFIGRRILPVGVTPVTTVVTEIRYGAVERAQVHRLDGRAEEVLVGKVEAYISERANPENHKQVDFLTVELPELAAFRGLKFVDTPGLESALSHNTETSMSWLPNVGLALVAVSVDPPLSQRDIDLLRGLYQFTPKVAILLTKTDLLKPDELAEVLAYVNSQLAKNFTTPPEVFPYSTRPGFEHFQRSLTDALVRGTLERFAEERDSILSRKLDTFLNECGEYVTLTLRSADMIQSERHALKRQAIGEQEILDDVKSEIRLVVQHAAAGTRSGIGSLLESHQSSVEHALIEEFRREFPKWTRSLAVMLSSFEDWLGRALERELTAVSLRQRNSFVSPLHKVQKQAFRILQQFRDRLSDRTMRAFGVPLRTTETEIEIVEPTVPDIRVGHSFDRNWELLSPVVPVWLVRGIVYRHFVRTISDRVYQNLSRLTTQWEESVNDGLWRMDKEAKRRLDELIATVDRLIESSSQERAPQFRADLERICMARKALTREPG